MHSVVYLFFLVQENSNTKVKSSRNLVAKYYMKHAQYCLLIFFQYRKTTTRKWRVMQLISYKVLYETCTMLFTYFFSIGKQEHKSEESAQLSCIVIYETCTILFTKRQSLSPIVSLADLDNCYFEFIFSMQSFPWFVTALAAHTEIVLYLIINIKG